MKLAILSCFHPYRGGIAQFNAGIFTELGRAHQVKAFNFKRQYPSLLFPGKTQFVTEQDEAVPVPSEALLDSICPGSWLRTARAIRAWKPDFLILRYWMPFFAPCLGFVARRMNPGVKVIGILDNVIPHERRPFDGLLTQYFLSGLDGAVTLCEEVGRDLQDLPHPVYTHFGEKLSRSDTESSLGLLPGKKNLLFFGLIREYKGLDILLEAFSQLDDSYQLIPWTGPAFKIAVDDDLIRKSPFDFELASVIVNDSHTRLSITRDEERKFLKFVKEDPNFCKYYEAGIQGHIVEAA